MLLYCVPYVFLAMWIEWLNCPTGLVLVELPLAIIPLTVLAVRAGRAQRKKRIVVGNIINFMASGVLTVLLCVIDPPLNKCGNIWFTYFEPLDAIVLFLLVEVLLFFLQWMIYRITSPGNIPPILRN